MPVQVDIFSLGVIMYELFMMTPLTYLISRSGLDEELLSYAHCVSMGHREELKATWPEAIQVSHITSHAGEFHMVVV